VTPQNKHRFIYKIPGQTFLWLSVAIFGASSAVTRKLTEIGAQHAVNGHNPVSLCNVLFVGNLCALMLLVTIYWKQLTPTTLRRVSGKEWFSLVIVAILSGALAPALFFLALSQATVNNVVLVGRIEPPLTLALSIWILRERVTGWEIWGAIAAFIGVALTIILQPPAATVMTMGNIGVGVAEVLVGIGAIASSISAVLGKRYLDRVPLGLYSIVRTALGTIVFFFVALGLYGRTHFMDVLSPFLWQWMLLYGAVIVVLGRSLWMKGLRSSTLSAASLVASFTPVASILAAYWILGEAPVSAQYIGGSAIFLGIVLSQIGLQRKEFAKGSKHSKSSALTEQAMEARMGFKGI
jgi:drug/metabolite transporter (DMT)-like permease